MKTFDVLRGKANLNSYTALNPLMSNFDNVVLINGGNEIYKLNFEKHRNQNNSMNPRFNPPPKKKYHHYS